MFQVAMLSKWHVHAEGYAQQILDTGKAKIVAVWDEQPARGKEWAAALGVDFEADLDALLERDDVHGVVIDTPTNLHLEVIRKAAAAKKHIFTEKTLCLTEADALEAAELVREAGVMFTISMPGLVSPEIQYIKDTIDKGLLGEITVLRIRNGHNGATGNWLPAYWYDPVAAGGGAMMDLGCHPVYQANWLLGKPERVSAMFTQHTNRVVDDNAMMSVVYENKAIAILETSFVTYKTPGSIEVYGTEGTIILDEHGLRMVSSKVAGAEKNWMTPTNLPKAKPMPIAQFVEAAVWNNPELINASLDEGVVLSNVLEKAYISDKEQKIVAFD
ncbi:MAG: Gfo/Idh/MocA family oxidoreductase [Anaerolineaceae bacterium]|nr:Gfo/Idh/MocA family oxidoreductase [Anaerolineaceae bacterium]